MPLLVPGINNNNASAQDANSQDAWQAKLMGKTLSTENSSSETVFAVKDLPEVHRIIQPGQNVTRDLNENRLNVCLDGDGLVHNVYYG
ncbi:hypothetical protein TD95_001770 [Thielaviopsis punctulata]|uniref:Proteinase inhibitor I78 n=1 Tax=Thielaviopsis punctulata TaxID=72032 RepID=A0A0F4Z8Y4_9PEZI|nr:hypothetical protein TD95_001770 [Thielaviopsis punctulata]